MTRIERLAGVGDEAIGELLDAAFGPNRHGRTAYRIRLGMAWLTHLSFAAFDADERLVGTLQSWPVALREPDGAESPFVMVGPVAVRPDAQGAGVGRALMDRLIETADLAPHDPLMMIGDPDYYGRFWGFTAEQTGGWDAPGPVERHRVLMRTPARALLPEAGMLGPRGSALRIVQPSLSRPALHSGIEIPESYEGYGTGAHFFARWPLRMRKSVTPKRRNDAATHAIGTMP